MRNWREITGRAEMKWTKAVQRDRLKGKGNRSKRQKEGNPETNMNSNIKKQ